MLSDGIKQYFGVLGNGFEVLLPPCRIKNRQFLTSLYDALLNEPTITTADEKHLKTLMIMADRVEVPLFYSVQDYSLAEAYLLKACDYLDEDSLKHALYWAFLLFIRHGKIEADLGHITSEVSLWRKVQTFPDGEYCFLTELIEWLNKNQYSVNSIKDIVSEYKKFKDWMTSENLNSLSSIDDLALKRYLLKRAYQQKSTSKKKILAKVRVILWFYKELFDGGYVIPEYAISVFSPTGVNCSANFDEVDALWDALEEGQCNPAEALMLTLIMGHGLHVRFLPFLKMTDTFGTFILDAVQPNRQGVKTELIELSIEQPWLNDYIEAYLSDRTGKSYPYLFVTGYAVRRKKPVSDCYCQRMVQRQVKAILGYPIPVNHLERGAIKMLAKQEKLPDFMAKTELIPISKGGRLMYWLNQVKL